VTPGSRGDDFVICPHCWHLNPASRVCARCLADMTTVLQESGGARWTAPVQSPVPVRAGRRLTRRQRAALLGVVVLFTLGQLALAFGGAPRPAPEPRPATDDR
jgi:hypothetical protein